MRKEGDLTSTLQTSEGFRFKTRTETYKIRRVIPPSGGVKGEVVVLYFESLTTQNLKSSGVPDVLGRSSKSEAQRVNNRVI
jgi:hypothetical protein